MSLYILFMERASVKFMILIFSKQKATIVFGVKLCVRTPF